MSVLIEFSIFPLDQGESVSEQVSQVVKMIREAGFVYQLTPMGTIIETETADQALGLVGKSAELLQALGAKRVYSCIKLDIRHGDMGRMTGKIRSVEEKIGPVNRS